MPLKSSKSRACEAVPLMRAASRALVRRAVRWLEQVQQANGGWGETCRSYDDPTLAGQQRPSKEGARDFQTGHALWALQAAGTPADNPDLYEKFSPATYTRDFKTPTLVIHGEQDFRDVTGQGLQLFTVLQQQRCRRNSCSSPTRATGF